METPAYYWRVKEESHPQGDGLISDDDFVYECKT